MKPETIGQRVAGVHLPIKSDKAAEDLREAGYKIITQRLELKHGRISIDVTPKKVL